jgi:hypothetical protein
VEDTLWFDELDELTVLELDEFADAEDVIRAELVMEAEAEDVEDDATEELATPPIIWNCSL